MGKSDGCIGIFFFCLLFGVSPVKSYGPLVPALYIFGDSLIDCGNNNYLSTTFRANNPPYGSDFLGGPTGRFSNGKTVADFIAMSLGLPLVPPYLDLSQITRNGTTKGINYGSGSAGILLETGTMFGENLNLKRQVIMFEETVTRNLPQKFQNSKQLSDYLSKCIFLFDIGSSDYIDPHMPGHATDPSKPRPQKTPSDFATLLTNELSKYLQRLYELGARKFVVFEVGPVGCIPATITKTNSKGCIEEINQSVSIYNQKLSLLLQSLKSSLKGSTFSQVKLSMNAAGLGNIKNTCCIGPRNGTLPCVASQPSCKNANEYPFFDGFHPTEAMNSKLAASIFSDSTVCSPLSIQELAKV